METIVYNAQGKNVGTVKLPDDIFGLPWNASLMHQVVTSMEDNARTNVAHAKTRGEVRGGGKKPWKQKGTGRARHGSIRSPIWKGGGVTHGPRNERNFSRAIPKGMRAKALFVALSKKLSDGEVIFVDSFALETPKTAAAKKTLIALSATPAFKALVTRKRNAALIAISDPRDGTTKSFRNIGNVTCDAVRNLNPVSVLKHKYLIVENPEAAVAILTHRKGKSVPTKKK